MTRLFISFLLASFIQLFSCSSPVYCDEQKDCAKTLMVLYFDRNCHDWCGVVRPIVAELKKKYSDRVDFIEIDVTQDKLPEAMKVAKEYGIGGWVNNVIDYVPEVAIYSASKGKRKCFKELVGPKPNETYEANLKEALAKEK